MNDKILPLAAAIIIDSSFGRITKLCQRDVIVQVNDWMIDIDPDFQVCDEKIGLVQKYNHI